MDSIDSPVEAEASAGLNVAETKLVVSIACGTGVVVAKLPLPDALKFFSIVQAAVIRMEKAAGPLEDWQVKIKRPETELADARAQIAKLTFWSGD